MSMQRMLTDLTQCRFVACVQHI